MRTRAAAVLLILGLAVLSAALGSASSLSLGEQRLATKGAPVPPCDSSLSGSWTAAFNTSLQTYTLATITVSGIDATTCAGAVLKVTPVNAGGSVLATEKSAGVGASDTSLSFSVVADAVPADSIRTLHAVLVGPMAP